MNEQRSIRRSVLLLLTLLFATGCLLCGIVAVSQNYPPKPEQPPQFFHLTEDVHIVYPSGTCSDDLQTSVTLLTNAGKDMLGHVLTATDDTAQNEPSSNTLQILLGHTNRPESVEVSAELAYYDYTYQVISPTAVVICGGSDSTTLTAAQKFLRDCYYYQPGMQRDARDVPVGTAYTYRHDYKLTLTLSGTPLEQFTIVYQDSTGHLSAAQHLQRQFSKVCGLNLPLASAREYGGGNAILLGMADLNGSHLHPDYGAYSMALACREQAASIQVIVDSTADLHLVAQAFADTALTGAPTRGSHDIRLPDVPRIYCICTDTMYALALQQTTAPERISDGLLYHRRIYSDKSQKPVVAHVMEVDLDKLDILNATPQYGDEIYHVRSTTLDAMKAVENAGFQAVAGVNADFFRIRGDCSPEGLCIKQGKLLSDPNGNPWFGITADGKAVMGTAADYSKYAGILQEAVGASTVLLKNGFVEDVEYDSDERSDRHPRTFLGTRPDGTVVIVAVDGRQEMLSNGASWSDMAQILLELDVTDGVNLDGGGSTTFITASEPGVYTVRNSPSGGTLREVYNSLVIVKQ